MTATTTLNQLQAQSGNLPATVPLQKRELVSAGFFSDEGFALLQRVSKMFASSSLVPKHYQNDVSNCAIALNIARRLNADELMVMQNLYIVHGNPGWSSKFLIASVNTCGRYESMRYEWRGKPGATDYGCRAWTVEKTTGEKLEGTWIDWKLVRAEGWDKKNGSKWLTMPDQMFMYRAAAFWQRAYAPEISMGFSSKEELDDMTIDAAPGTVRTIVEMQTPEKPAAQSETQEAEPNPETGEVSGPTYAQMADRIKTAKNLDEKLEALDSARHLSDQMQGELKALAGI